MTKQELTKLIEIKNEIIKTMEEYIKLLGDEVNVFACFAYTHGIFSTKEDVKKGYELREKIKELKVKSYKEN
jgi:hypothetical protein